MKFLTILFSLPLLFFLSCSNEKDKNLSLYNYNDVEVERDYSFSQIQGKWSDGKKITASFLGNAFVIKGLENSSNSLEGIFRIDSNYIHLIKMNHNFEKEEKSISREKDIPYTIHSSKGQSVLTLTMDSTNIVLNQEILDVCPARSQTQLNGCWQKNPGKNDNFDSNIKIWIEDEALLASISGKGYNFELLAHVFYQDGMFYLSKIDFTENIKDFYELNVSGKEGSGTFTNIYDYAQANRLPEYAFLAAALDSPYSVLMNYSEKEGFLTLSVAGQKIKLKKL